MRKRREHKLVVIARVACLVNNPGSEPLNVFAGKHKIPKNNIVKKDFTLLQCSHKMCDG